jgi:hypothetical protein
VQSTTHSGGGGGAGGGGAGGGGGGGVGQALWPLVFTVLLEMSSEKLFNSAAVIFAILVTSKSPQSAGASIFASHVTEPDSPGSRSFAFQVSVLVAFV